MISAPHPLKRGLPQKSLPPTPAQRPSAPALLDQHSTEELASQLDQARDVVTRAFRDATDPCSRIQPGEAARLVGAIDLDSPLPDTEAALAELRSTYLDHAVWFHHPRYQAHLNCPVALPAVVADVIGSAVNSSLDTWDQSATATAMERHLIGWTAERIGFAAGSDGIFTGGGTQSNLHALLLAREEARAGGVPLERLRVIASADAHFSSRKAAGLLGLPDDALVTVRPDAHGRIDAADIATAIDDVRRDGGEVMAVVATAGTTDLGCIDPLAAIAEVTRAREVWLHVDAAYGGGLLASTRRRHLLDGIEYADSVTVDFHKTFFQPVASSALVVADAATLRHGRHHAAYLNPEEDAERLPNQVDKSLQTTRRFDALKLWMTLRVLGPDRVGEMFDEAIDLAEAAREVLAADDEYVVVDGTDLSTVVFRYTPAGADEELLDLANLTARERLMESGYAVVARTTRSGRSWLKLTLLNPNTPLSEVRAVLEALREQAAEALAELEGDEGVA